MPLSTLQLTGRLGYRQENALAMLTMGCHNTLWAIRSHLEPQRGLLDDQDRRALALARKWMGVEGWPADAAGKEDLRKAWRCQRTACVFHPHHCAHGASPAEQFIKRPAPARLSICRFARSLRRIDMVHSFWNSLSQWK